MLNLLFEPFPVIETKRLRMRALTQDDARALFFLRSDPQVIEHLNRAPAGSVEEISELIEKINSLQKSGDAIHWTITLKESPEMIGSICLWNINKDHHRAELGYLLHPAHQRKGLMREAMEKTIGYGFNRMKLHSIEANVNPDNIASIRLLEKNNFVREGYYRENFFYDRKYYDSVIYSLLAPKH